MTWEKIDSAPEDVAVETKIEDHHGTRNQTTLIKRGWLWFTPDVTMYVYYRPTHWRYVEVKS